MVGSSVVIISVWCFNWASEWSSEWATVCWRSVTREKILKVCSKLAVEPLIWEHFFARWVIQGDIQDVLRKCSYAVIRRLWIFGRGAAYSYDIKQHNVKHNKLFEYIRVLCPLPPPVTFPWEISFNSFVTVIRLVSIR